MTVTGLDQDAARLLVTLITFKWVAGVDPALQSQARGYARSASNVTLAGTPTLVWIGIPVLETKMGKQHGGSHDQPVEIRMPPVEPFTTLILQDGIFPPIECTIEEADPTDPTTLRTLFQGRVSQVVQNPGRLADIIKITVTGYKQQTDIPLGIIANHTCPWAFGDKNCCISDTLSLVSFFDLRETGTIDSISGHDMVILGLTTLTTRYWHRGYINVEGAQILVREYTTGTTFTLAKAPPSIWVGKTVVVTPGCDKTIETCRSKWTNEAHFGGLGIAMPGYHPVFESN